MDGQRFDEWTKALASETSRRSAFKAAAGSLVSALALVRAGEADAQDLAAEGQCKGNGARCTKDKNCCSKRCRNGNCACANNGAGCKANSGCCSGRCKSGTCQCARKNDGCQNDKDCCSDRCQNNNCSCSRQGSSCVKNSDCCSGLQCKGGTCKNK